MLNYDCCGQGTALKRIEIKSRLVVQVTSQPNSAVCPHLYYPTLRGNTSTTNNINDVDLQLMKYTKTPCKG